MVVFREVQLRNIDQQRAGHSNTLFRQVALLRCLHCERPQGLSIGNEPGDLFTDMAGSRQAITVSNQLRGTYQGIGKREFVRNSSKAMELDERFRQVTGKLPFLL